jgi:hypothetical protein
LPCGFARFALRLQRGLALTFVIVAGAGENNDGETPSLRIFAGDGY